MPIEPFAFDVTQVAIDALRTPLGHTRWAPELDNVSVSTVVAVMPKVPRYRPHYILAPTHLRP